MLLKKVREHFFAAKLLELTQADVYVDVASDSSPAPMIYERLFGCTCLRQDLSYPPGQRGRRFGGSAGRIAMAAASVDKMALHCAFEHFEDPHAGDFLREAARVLRPSGRLAIVPAYLADRMTVLSNVGRLAETPAEEWPSFPDGADLRATTSGNRFERYYGPKELISLVRTAGSLRPTLYVLERSACITLGQLKFALLLEKVPK